MTKKELMKNLRDRKWRINHLYYIKNNQGERIKFKMNWAQEQLFDNLWYLNIILKARQLGITTFACILFLDDVIFNGYDAGLIAHTLQDATKIFDTKVKYAWDNLPETIKRNFTLNIDSARELKFKQGKIESSIYVGTSLRSQTVQRLHISELGSIDQKYPGKSEEIRSGALNTVHKGQVVIMESTARGQTGNFYDFCREALDNKKSKTELTEMDYKIFFFPWWKHPEYKLEGKITITRELQDYFEKLEKSEGIILTREQKQWYFKKKQQQKDSMKSEFPSTPAEAFQANIEGAYFGKQMDKVMEEGRIMRVPYDSKLNVDTWWDLGVEKRRSDATAIVFTQQHGIEIRIIDYYGNTGEGLAHYKKVLDEKQYSYGTHNAPHDIEVKELGTGKTRLEIARSLGIRFRVLPRLGFLDGIEATRTMLSRCWFDEEKTSHLIKALKAFRKEWDDKLGKFKDTPLKDWSSDIADAVRMCAIGQKELSLNEKGYEQKYEDRADVRADRQYEEAREFNPLNPFS